MSSVAKVYMVNSLRPTLYKLCTYLSTAIVDKFLDVANAARVHLGRNVSAPRKLCISD